MSASARVSSSARARRRSGTSAVGSSSWSSPMSASDGADERLRRVGADGAGRRSRSALTVVPAGSPIDSAQRGGVAASYSASDQLVGLVLQAERLRDRAGSCSFHDGVHAARRRPSARSATAARRSPRDAPCSSRIRSGSQRGDRLEVRLGDRADQLDVGGVARRGQLQEAVVDTAGGARRRPASRPGRARCPARRCPGRRPARAARGISVSPIACSTVPRERARRRSLPRRSAIPPRSVPPHAVSAQRDGEGQAGRRAARAVSSISFSGGTARRSDGIWIRSPAVCNTAPQAR